MDESDKLWQHVSRWDDRHDPLHTVVVAVQHLRIPFIEVRFLQKLPQMNTFQINRGNRLSSMFTLKAVPHPLQGLV